VAPSTARRERKAYVIHVRYEGRSYDVPERDIRLPAKANDSQVLEIVAGHLRLDMRKLRHYVVDRRPSGSVIVRPEAVYG
jgi:hypothetical protein